MSNKILNTLPAFLLQNKHLNTCYPTLFRKINISYKRELIITPDQDFFYIDWIKNKSKNLIILCHGLEGSSESSYIKGLSKFLSDKNFDILIINHRGCGGEINLNAHFYHYGFTKDLELIINKFHTNYTNVALIGFSMGGNILLKYLGKNIFISKKIKCSIAIAPVLDINTNIKIIDSFKNYIYRQRFLSSLKNKVIKKYNQNSYLFNRNFDIITFKKVTTFFQYDKLFTVPYNNYTSIQSFYEENSSIFYLDQITIPTYILASKDDPLVSIPTNLEQICLENKNLSLELANIGGHVGFLKQNNTLYWYEEKIFSYLKTQIKLE
ncbi:YheT family hydrolase [Cetobacterium sp.]|uniref:YheT family hydrolase n=1 Tax=Cetobacterium sp. TaxID=2071632 RepID=UPI003EE6BD1F